MRSMAIVAALAVPLCRRRPASVAVRPAGGSC